jgi:hypothetical protein
VLPPSKNTVTSNVARNIASCVCTFRRIR